MRVEDTRGFVHHALVYGSEDELLDTAVPFLRAGLDAGEAGLVVCSERNNELLSQAFDGDQRIMWLSQTEIYRRPAGTIAAYRQSVEQLVAAGGSRVRHVGEVRFDGGPAEWAEWARYEAVLNRALAPYPLSTVCPYDSRRLPAEVLADAELTHPNLLAPTSRTSSERYLDPLDFLRRSARPGPDPLEATEPTLELEDVADLRNLRELLHMSVTESAPTAQTAQEFVFAVHEVATNAVRHGRPPIRVRVWSTPDRTLCTVSDRGGGFDNPFAGYTPAREDPSEYGRGLWMARQLCDRVEFSGTAEGFIVRLSARH
jgi:anti-sigma regulatory factor (Ser/Thr protein kinase)